MMQIVIGKAENVTQNLKNNWRLTHCTALNCTREMMSVMSKLEIAQLGEFMS